jgi:hypothetical protein
LRRRHLLKPNTATALCCTRSPLFERKITKLVRTSVVAADNFQENGDIVVSNYWVRVLSVCTEGSVAYIAFIKKTYSRVDASANGSLKGLS